MSLMRKTAVHLTARAITLHTSRLLPLTKYSSAKSTVKLTRSFSTSDTMATAQRQDLGELLSVVVVIIMFYFLVRRQIVLNKHSINAGTLKKPEVSELISYF